MTPRARRLVAATSLILLVSAGCIEGPLYPSSSLFPEVSWIVRARHCVRGAAMVPADIQGIIDTNDCHVAPGLGYADAYRIRVQDTLVVTFQTLAPVGYDPPILDTELDLFRVDDLDDYDASRVLLVHDDDSGDGPAALLSFPLMPLIEYLIVVKGKDDFSVGRYRLLVAP